MKSIGGTMKTKKKFNIMIVYILEPYLLSQIFEYTASELAVKSRVIVDIILILLWAFTGILSIVHAFHYPQTVEKASKVILFNLVGNLLLLPIAGFFVMLGLASTVAMSFTFVALIAVPPLLIVDVFLLILAHLIYLPFALLGVNGAVKAYRQGDLPLKKTIIWSVLQFILVANIVSSIRLYVMLRKAEAEKIL